MLINIKNVEFDPSDLSMCSSLMIYYHYLKLNKNGYEPTFADIDNFITLECVRLSGKLLPAAEHAKSFLNWQQIREAPSNEMKMELVMGISVKILKDYKKKHPEFMERKK